MVPPRSGADSGSCGTHVAAEQATLTVVRVMKNEVLPSFGEHVRVNKALPQEVRGRPLRHTYEPFLPHRAQEPYGSRFLVGTFTERGMFQLIVPMRHLVCANVLDFFYIIGRKHPSLPLPRTFRAVASDTFLGKLDIGKLPDTRFIKWQADSLRQLCDRSYLFSTEILVTKKNYVVLLHG